MDLMAEDSYRIDDLARLAGTTVRNVRAYQDRGLLPPPEKVGRVGWYSQSHLARLRLIGEMLARGYTLSNIAELVDGWARGQNLSEVLGLEEALIAPWGEDHSSVFSRQALRALFEPLGPEHLDAALAIGLITDEGGDRFRVSDPRLIEAAGVLVDAGVPFDVVLQIGTEIAAAADNIARMYVEMVTKYLLGEGDEPISPEEVRRLSELVQKLRPMAKAVVDTGLSEALDRRIAAEVSRQVSRVGASEQSAAS
jgi:DNA-binding transcriptional MerR regulator